MKDINNLLDFLKRSPELAAKKFGKIINKNGDLVQYLFNRMQRRAMAWLIEDLEAGIPIRWNILKARQLGFTTWITWLFFWVIWLFKYRRGHTASYDADSVKEIFEKVKLFYGSIPAGIRPLQKRSNRTELFLANPDPDATGENLGMQSKLTISTIANQNLGAGRTLQLVHLSEIARYEGLVNIQSMMASLRQSLPYKPGTMMFWETTAQGQGWYKDQWDKHVSLWVDFKKKKGPRPMFRPVFISWIADEEYKLPLASGQVLILESVEDSIYGDEIAEAEEIRSQIEEWYPEYEKQEIEVETMARINWRRWKINNEFEDDKYLFRQEYPTTPEQAFQTTGSQVFDQRILAGYKSYAKDQPYKSYRYIAANVTDSPDWYKEVFAPGTGDLRVYEAWDEMDRNSYYLISADTSYGVDEKGDKSAAHVWKLPDMKQVAVFDGLIDPGEFGNVLYALGVLYNYALIAPEIQASGSGTMHRLWNQLLYPNMYYREGFNTIDFQRMPKFGFSTDSTSKPIMIANMKRFIKDGKLILNDLPTVEQLIDFKKLPKRTGNFSVDKFGPSEGKHDDLVMAAMIGVVVSLQEHIPIYKPPAEYYAKNSFREIGKAIDRHARWEFYLDNNRARGNF